MNTAPIRAAVIDRDADGTPRSREHDDLYHPRSGALVQARHVFLDGDRTAERWRGRDRFVVLETGFGLGNNFLATWAAWRADPDRCRRLHFLSIESMPPTRADLTSIVRDPAVQPLADALASRWPPLTWNLHRLAFDDGAVELLLAFGDVASWLPQMAARIDAFFLDGFAPARNPAMWDARLYKAMARLAAPRASVTTWTAARGVREGLRSAGFEVALAQGSHGKRDITRAVFAPTFVPRPAPGRIAATRASERRSSSDEPVVIVGAGLAGCSLAAALAEHGRASLLVDRASEVASAASGNAAGLFHGVVHAADGRHARFHRAAALAAREAVERARAVHGVAGSSDGLLRVEPDAARDGASLQAIVDRLGLPPDYVRVLSAGEAGALAGVTLAAPAWHFPGGGWVDPRALCRSWLADAGSLATARLGVRVAALQREGGRWSLVDAEGAVMTTASTIVFCTASGSLDERRPSPWPVRRQRGQLSAIRASEATPGTVPTLPISGSGYVLPAIDGTVWFGSTSEWDDDDPAVRDTEHHDNLERWQRLVDRPRPSDAALSGRTSWRWVSGDRLPIIGAVPAQLLDGIAAGRHDEGSSRRDQPRFVEREAGLFVFGALGSRGIASAALGGRMLAAAITGAPSVVEADLIDAVDPARFVSRQFRRDESARHRDAASADQAPAEGSPGAAA